MRWVWPWLCLGAVACATPPPPPVVKPMYKDGVLQRALTPKDMVRFLRQAVPDFDVCYRREHRNLAPKLSNYVLQVFVSADGTPADIEVLSETEKSQVILRACVIAAAEKIRFPAHLGDDITLKVPIEGQ